MQEFKAIPTEIAEYLSYNPENGKLYWKKPTGKKVVVGREAGSIGSDGAILIRFKGDLYLAHRMAWFLHYGSISCNIEIDHKDMDNVNNRIKNLRLATRLQNQANRRGGKGSISGLKGVSMDRRSGKWRARIKYKGRERYLGLFDDPSEAHAAYVRSANELYGEFARAA